LLLAAAGIVLVVVTAAALLPVGSHQRVPPEVAVSELVAVEAAADGLRRSLGEAVDDLAVAAGTTGPGVARTKVVLDTLVDQRDRYPAVAWAHAGRIRYTAGDGDLGPHPETAAMTSRPIRFAGTVNRQPLVLLTVPLRQHPGDVVVAAYRPDRLSSGLAALRRGSHWLLAADGGVVGSSGGFIAGRPLSDPQLLRAAARARSGDPSGLLDRNGRLITWAAVADDGAGLHWVVVGSRDHTDLGLSDVVARRSLTLLAILVTLVTALSVGWMVIAVALPIRHLAAELDRVQDGRNGGPIVVRRLDEIGVMARQLDRVHKQLELTEPRR